MSKQKVSNTEAKTFKKLLKTYTAKTSDAEKLAERQKRFDSLSVGEQMRLWETREYDWKDADEIIEAAKDGPDGVINKASENFSMRVDEYLDEIDKVETVPGYTPTSKFQWVTSPPVGCNTSGFINRLGGIIGGTPGLSTDEDEQTELEKANKRIAELEKEVESQADCIDEMQTTLREMTTELAKMRREVDGLIPKFTINSIGITPTLNADGRIEICPPSSIEEIPY